MVVTLVIFAMLFIIDQLSKYLTQNLFRYFNYKEIYELGKINVFNFSNNAFASVNVSVLASFSPSYSAMNSDME